MDSQFPKISEEIGLSRQDKVNNQENNSNLEEQINTMINLVIDDESINMNSLNSTNEEHMHYMHDLESVSSKKFSIGMNTPQNTFFKGSKNNETELNYRANPYYIKQKKSDSFQDVYMNYNNIYNNNNYLNFQQQCSLNTTNSTSESGFNIINFQMINNFNNNNAMNFNQVNQGRQYNNQINGGPISTNCQQIYNVNFNNQQPNMNTMTNKNYGNYDMNNQMSKLNLSYLSNESFYNQISPRTPMSMKM